MVYTDYFSNYKSIYDDAMLANDNVSSNPAVNLSSSLNDFEYSIGSVNFDSWQDVNGKATKSILDGIKSNVSVVKSVITEGMGKSDQLYRALARALAQLKKEQNTFSTNYEAKPNNPEAENYNALLMSWETNCGNNESTCKELAGTIDEILADLKKINGLSVSSESLSTISGINVPFVQATMDDFTEEQQERLRELFSLIDFTLLGSSEEEVMALLANSDYTSWWGVSEIIQNTPSNFNEIMANYHPDEFTADPDNYWFIYGSGDPDKTIDDYNRVTQTINIGGYDIEIIDIIDKGRYSNPFELSKFYVQRAAVINMISHMTPNQLKAQGTLVGNNTGDRTNPAIILSDYLYWNGGYFTGDVIVGTNRWISNVYNAFTHEAGHKVDNVVGGENNFDQLINPYFSVQPNGWTSNICYNDTTFADLFASEYNDMERIVDPNYNSNPDFTNFACTNEAMAELGKFYTLYPDELKLACPELYELYNGYINGGQDKGKIDNVIVIDGSPISPEDERTLDFTS